VQVAVPDIVRMGQGDATRYEPPGRGHTTKKPSTLSIGTIDASTIRQSE
jgi:hypothetical protein